MKKTLVALATLAVAGGAFAQSGMARDITGSGVTIFGVADATITNFRATDAGSVNRLQGEGRNESTRLGFRGIEDIGGGWGAAFWLEAAYAQDTGAGSTTTANNTSIAQSGILNATSNSGASPTLASASGQQGLTFNRAANVSLLNKDLGEIRLGRDYNPTFWNLTYFDPFGTVGAGAYTNISLGTLNVRNQVVAPGNPSPQVRASNSLGWLSNNINGFRFQAQYALSEQMSTCTDLGVKGAGQDSNLCSAAANAGNNIGYRLSYASGPLTAGAAWSKTTYQNSAAILANAGSGAGVTAYTGDFTAMNFAAAYDLGVAKIMVQMGQNEYGQQSYAYENGTAGTGIAGAAVASTKWGTVGYTPVTVKHNLIGATIPSGALTYKVSYATATRSGGAGTFTAGADRSGVASASYSPTVVAEGAKQTQFAFGGVYDLSKRTAVYGTWSQMKATGANATASQGVASVAATASADVSATTIDLGVRHRF